MFEKVDKDLERIGNYPDENFDKLYNYLPNIYKYDLNYILWSFNILLYGRYIFIPRYVLLPHIAFSTLLYPGKIYQKITLLFVLICTLIY